MKKIFLITAAILLGFAIKAQPIQVQSAFNYMKRGQLDKAKEAIDAAIIHEKTMNDPKTWFYKGNIYLDIHLSKEPKYKALEKNALQIAYDAFQKSIELDAEKEYFDQVKIRLYICGEQFYNQGVALFNTKDFENAIIAFEKTAKVNMIFQVQDSLATFNAALCGQLCAQQAKEQNDTAKVKLMNQKAKENFQKLVRMNYRNPSIYISLSDIYKYEGDTAQALKVVQNGRVKFPDDYNLIITETNIYLARGETDKAQQNLKLAVEKNPNNENLHFAIGANYDVLGNFEEAEKAYKKALEIKPAYFDATYNLGALYFNKGVSIFEKADKITDMKLYDVEKEKFEAMWKEALPYLEKAHEIDPKDRNTMISLSQLYARMKMYDKAKALKEQMEQK